MKTPILVLVLLLPASIIRSATMDDIAKAYVKLVLAVGQHDPDYVDAYYGPTQWEDTAKLEKKSLDAIAAEAAILTSGLKAIDVSASDDEMLKLRYEYLSGQLASLAARVEMLQGRRFTFDQESKLLYDAVAPKYTADHFKAILKRLDMLLPGKGSIQTRYEQFRSKFIIPADKLEAVFGAAIKECRRKTKEHIALPANESFTVEYVTNKPWGGYNWYKGHDSSLIQVNTDLPSYIDRPIDLAAHEGYPGHHVYNALLEDHMVRQRGWMEFTVYPLFSPQSLIAEGSANYGVHVVMTNEERLHFEQAVLYPLAGLDTAQTEMFDKVSELVKQLSYAGNEAARGYLDGTMSRDAAVQWLEEYGLMTPDRARKRMDFIDKYRSYVINYNLGEDLVRKYIESRSGTPEQRWEEFARLISSPRLPSGIIGE
jgi:hypothetical protein